MKLIEAMRKVKDLYIKAEDLRKMIAQHSADLDYQTAVYPEQSKYVSGWLQAHHDISLEIGRLQLAIQRTNLATTVQIAIGDKLIAKTISEWLYRRGPKDKKGLASLDCAAWSMLTDRNLREGQVQLSPGLAPMQVKLRRYYDPVERDGKVQLYKSEPMLIDAALEVANATTELVEQ